MAASLKFISSDELFFFYFSTLNGGGGEGTFCIILKKNLVYYTTVFFLMILNDNYRLKFDVPGIPNNSAYKQPLCLYLGDLCIHLLDKSLFMGVA